MRALAVLLISLTLLVPAAANAAPDAPPTWVVTVAATVPYDSMNDDAQALPQVPERTILQLLKTEGDWSYVQNPRTHDSSFVDTSVLAPSDAPSRYLTMPAPKLQDEFEARGVVTDQV